MNPNDYRFAMTGAVVISAFCSIYIVFSLVEQNKPLRQSAPSYLPLTTAELIAHPVQTRFITEVKAELSVSDVTFKQNANNPAQLTIRLETPTRLPKSDAAAMAMSACRIAKRRFRDRPPVNSLEIGPGVYHYAIGVATADGSHSFIGVKESNATGFRTVNPQLPDLIRKLLKDP